MSRWPIVRHIRYYFAAWKFSRWWQYEGRFLGAVPNQSDLEHLEAIWVGKA